MAVLNCVDPGRRSSYRDFDSSLFVIILLLTVRLEVGAQVGAVCADNILNDRRLDGGERCADPRLKLLLGELVLVKQAVFKVAPLSDGPDCLDRVEVARVCDLG